MYLIKILRLKIIRMSSFDEYGNRNCFNKQERTYINLKKKNAEYENSDKNTKPKSQHFLR